MGPEKKKKIVHYGFTLKLAYIEMTGGKQYEKIEGEFGQRDFLFCWRCTAVAFGAKTLKQKSDLAESEKTGTEEQEKTTAQKRAEHARAAIGQKGGNNASQKQEDDIQEHSGPQDAGGKEKEVQKV